MQNPQVLAAIDDFATVLGQLPGVLLILDTCEELAKADAGDPTAPAVRTTLAILERIHDRAPSVRVLFAGRRPLPARVYLDVQEVAGFTLDEARRYLAAFADAPLAAGLVDAIISQSPAVDAPITAPGEIPGRVSPFDLALYLSWADEDHNLDAPRVAQGSDAYIEGRIIERLRDSDVNKALPALASAGRCRLATIAAFVGGDAAVLGPRLAEQEWIDADGDPPLHIAAHPALASRLQHYFSAPDRKAGFSARTAELARMLRENVASVPLAEADVDELLAALRLSPPAEAAELWDDLANQATAAGRWNWLLYVTSRVLGASEEEQWPTATALRATVLASYIAASRRALVSFNDRAAWTEVSACADSHPRAAARQFLAARAALGLLPYAPRESVWDLIQPVLDRNVDPANHRLELAAAAADTVYRLIEAGAGQPGGQSGHDGFLGDYVRWLPPPRWGDYRVRAWALVALARLNAANDERDSSLSALADAEDEIVERLAADAEVVNKTGGEAGLADWIQPDDLLARVRLERGLMAAPQDDVLHVWESYAAGRLGTIDGERLASLCLRTRLDHGTIQPSVIEQWESRYDYLAIRVATCSAHDMVPPLFVTLADAWLAAGKPQRALAVVEQWRTDSLEERADDATLKHADAATVRIARRLHLDDRRALLLRLSDETYPDTTRLDLRDSARRALATIYGRLPLEWGEDVTHEPTAWHAWWQCHAAGTTPLPAALWSSGSIRGRNSQGTLSSIWRKCARLEVPSHQDLRDTLADWLARPRRRPARSIDPHRYARASLRRAALADESCERPPEVPPRLFAEMAFDEAELLTLRLPETAANLFAYAHVAYGSCGDRIGAVLAAVSRAVISADAIPLSNAHAEIENLKVSNPAAGAALTGPSDEAGPWRHWAAQLEYFRTLEKEGRPPVATEARSADSLVERLRRWTDLALDVLVPAVLVTSVGLLVYRTSQADFTIGLLSLLAALLAVTVATGAWRLRSVARVADARAVGAVRPAVIGFTVLIGGTLPGRDRLYLWAHVRPLAAAARRQWPRLAVLALAAGLAEVSRRGRSPGSLADTSNPEKVRA